MDPREIHELEQMRARLREIAQIQAMYREELVAGGVSEPEAWAEAQEVGRRLSATEFDRYEAARDNDVLARVLDRLESRLRRE